MDEALAELLLSDLDDLAPIGEVCRWKDDCRQRLLEAVRDCQQFMSDHEIARIIWEA